MLHCLHGEVKNLLKNVMSDFIQINCIRNGDPFTLDVHNSKLHVPVNQIYVGIDATDTLANSVVSKDLEGMTEFKKSCLAFLIEFIDQIRSRFHTEKYKLLSFFIPANALSMKPNSLREVFQAFPFLNEMCDRKSSDLEWRQIALDGRFEEEQDAAQFWKKQLSLKKEHGTDQPKFPNLCKIVGCALALPHSNAAVEHIFSQLKLIKTETRNSFKTTSLVSLLHVKNALRKDGISAHQLPWDDNLRRALEHIESNATDEQCQNILREKFAH